MPGAECPSTTAHPDPAPWTLTVVSLTACTVCLRPQATCAELADASLPEVLTRCGASTQQQVCRYGANKTCPAPKTHLSLCLHVPPLAGQRRLLDGEEWARSTSNSRADYGIFDMLFDLVEVGQLLTRCAARARLPSLSVPPPCCCTPPPCSPSL